MRVGEIRKGKSEKDYQICMKIGSLNSDECMSFYTEDEYDRKNLRNEILHAMRTMAGHYTLEEEYEGEEIKFTVYKT